MSPRRAHPVLVRNDRAALTPGSLWWAYLRHSPGDTQDIASQRRAVTEFAAAQGVVLVRLFEDAGQSGSSIQGRDAFEEMVQASKTDPRPVAGVVVWNLSRWARNELESQFFRADFRLRGYAVVSVADDVPGGDTSIVFEALLDWKNRRFLQDLTLDIKRGIRDVVLKEVDVEGQRRTGFSSGGFPPRGYRAVRVQTGTRTNGEPRVNALWELDPEWQDRVSRARQMFASGQSISAIDAETHLYRDLSSYRTFFGCETYAGIRRVGDIAVPDAHAAYDTPEQRAAILARLAEYQPRNRNAEGVPAKRPHMLSGILFCGHCSLPMHCNASTEGDYYRCASHNSTRKARRKSLGEPPEDCPSRRVLCRVLDEAVVGLLRREVFTKDRLASLIGILNADRQEGASVTLAERGRADRELRRLDREIANLVSAIAGGNTSQALNEALREREAQRAQVEGRRQQLLAAEVATRPLAVSQDQLAELVRQLGNLLASGQEQAIWRIVRSYVQRVEVQSDSATVYPTYPDPEGSRGRPMKMVVPVVAGTLNHRISLDVSWTRRRGRFPGTVQLEPTAHQREVLELRASGLKLREVATRKGCSVQRVHEIVKRWAGFRTE